MTTGNRATLRIGFIPLVDSAVLVAAADKGFAAEEDLALELVREVSWANIRDKLILGHFDAAHCLAPLAIAATLGLDYARVPMLAPLALSLNGNAIIVSAALHAALLAAADGDLEEPKVSGAALRWVVAPAHRIDAMRPFVLNTGRFRDQWHTMTRTGKSARLARHRPEPLLEMHPDDAATIGLAAGDVARVEGACGASSLRVRLESTQRRGEVFAPMHWSDANAAGVRVNAAVNSAVDPVSGQPELKHTPVRIERLSMAWSALALSRQPLAIDAAYWAKSAAASCLQYDIAGDGRAEQFFDCAERSVADQLGFAAAPRARDRADGRFRALWIAHGRLAACLFVAPQPEELDRDWLAAMFARQAIDATDRVRLLAGRPGARATDAGPMVCACFGVGAAAIQAAIATGSASVEALGRRLHCGTNCGSCIPELRALIAASKAREAA